MNAPGHIDDDSAAARRPLPIDLDEPAWALTGHDDYQGSSHWLNLGELEADPRDEEQSLRIMADFVDQLGDRHPAQREAWFAFERTALESIARRWCEGSGVTPQWTTRRQPPSA